MKYDEYQHLLFEHRDDGILLITINRPDVLNATNNRLHWELSRVWKDIDDDPETNVVVITGKGRAFSAGGDLEMIERMAGSAANIGQAWREAGDIVYNMINLDKPIISAINGVAVGAGLAVAFMADITIASENMRITDGHIRLGVGAGDHAVIIWPLLCGMAKAKYYLMTADFIDGKEAERIGLVSLCVPADKLMDKAMEVAQKLARGPQQALRLTKRSLNNWLQDVRAGFRRVARDWRCWDFSATTCTRAWRRSRNGARRRSRAPEPNEGVRIPGARRSARDRRSSRSDRRSGRTRRAGKSLRHLRLRSARGRAQFPHAAGNHPGPRIRRRGRNDRRGRRGLRARRPGRRDVVRGMRRSASPAARARRSAAARSSWSASARSRALTRS